MDNPLDSDGPVIFVKDMSDFRKTANILIVDDVPINLSILAQTLRDAGLTVWVATSGNKAIEQLVHALPDLILLDIQMPGIDGLETCAKLKANPRTKDIPVIFMTALGEQASKVEGLSLGAVDYITKPLQEAEVLARVMVHLNIRKLTQNLQREIDERKRVEAELAQANATLQRLAHIDGLTQVANRYRFDQDLDQAWRRLQRDQEPLSLILCDVDYFKPFNDRYGHQAGDDCLRQVAKAIQNAVNRPDDLVARYGGEEFAVVLPATPALGAKQIAIAISAEVLKLQIPHDISTVSQYITLSLGVATVIPNPEQTLDTLIELTDRALYRAKSEGRNMYCQQDFSQKPSTLSCSPSPSESFL